MGLQSFEFWARTWLTESVSKVKQTTHYGYALIVEKLILQFGSRLIGDIQPFDVQSYLDRLHQNGKAKSTINKHRYILQMIFRAAALGGEIRENPCLWARTPRLAKRHTRRALTLQEQKLILENINTEPCGFYAFCLLLSGLRRSELLAVCWEDIDTERGMIHVDKVVTYLRSRPHLEFFLKNGWRDRYLPIPHLLLQELIRRKLQAKTGLLFSQNGELLHESVVERRWKSYREKVGLNGVTQHMVRHTYASLLYDAGIDIKAAAALMGHSDERTTLMIYTHINKQKVAEQAMSKLNGLLAHGL